MKFNPGIDIGAELSNNEMCKLFKCGNMGGMRRSKQTGTLVIISDFTKGIYHDIWKDGILHYTGMGKSGDQVLKGNQNGTLYHSDTNGVEIHLFEVLSERIYTYRGVVELDEKPYQSMQTDSTGKMRRVWIFPVKPVLKSDNHVLDNLEEEIVKLSNTELNKRIRSNCVSKEPQIAKTKIYYRDPYLKELVKRIAEGKCQYCGADAPFIDKNNKPYLEEHHVKGLADGGSDVMDNVVAICPNCHRKAHVLEDEIIRTTLEGIAKQNVQRLNRLLSYERNMNCMTEDDYIV